MEQYILLNMNRDELKVLITDAVQKEFKKLKPEETKAKLLTKNEVIELFSISLTTLYRWDKVGLLPIIRIGSRVYYLESDISKIVEKNRFGGQP